MANSKRIYTNEAGQMFIPMNVDGGSGNASFWNSTKTMIIAAIGVADFFCIAWLASGENSWAFNLAIIVVLIIVNIMLIRKFIIEEKYYLKMYEKQKQFEVAEPSVFWNVNIQNRNILYYLDGKMGVVVKMERDTIVGKDDEFKERHYDAWSDFYRELNLNKLKRVQMSLMDTAGNDPRFKELDKLVVGAKFNENLKELVEKQIGHIKSKARNTLFEDDYFLIYTDNYVPYEELLQRVHSCMYKLTRGAFIGYKILERPELNELFKSEFKIKYFNEDNAAISLYGNVTKNVVAFKIKYMGINGDEYTVDNVGERELKNLSRKLHNGKAQYGDVDTLSLIVKKAPDKSSGDLELRTEEPEVQEEIEDNLDEILYDEYDEYDEYSEDPDNEEQTEVENNNTNDDDDDELIDF